MSFRGEHRHSLDAKSRLILPIKFRDTLGDSIIFLKGIDKCLFGFTTEAFAALEGKSRETPITNETNRRNERLFFSSTDEREFDSQGRVVIMQNLRDYAGITKDVVVLGLPKRIEIWDAQTWDKYCNGDTSYITEHNRNNEMAEYMALLGI